MRGGAGGLHKHNNSMGMKINNTKSKINKKNYLFIQKLIFSNNIKFNVIVLLEHQ